MSASQPFSVSAFSPRSRLVTFFSLAVLLGFWAVTIQRLGGLWSALPEYSYGWAVPMLCVILFLDRWRTRSEISAAIAPMVKSEEPRDIPLGRRLVRLRPRRDDRLREPLQPVVARAPRRWFGLSVATVCWLLFVVLCFTFSRAALEVIPTWRFASWALALSTVALTFFVLRMMLVAGDGAGAAKAESREQKADVESAELRTPTSVLPAPSSQLSVSLRRPAFPRISHFAFPICFFLLAVPWPDRFEGPFIQTLTELNAAVTVELMSLFKVVAVRLGNIILIEPGMVGVQEACSGIRSFQSTLMVALFLGELFRFSFWRRVVFVVLGAGLSFAFNIVRTSFLVWTCNREGLGAMDKFHDPAGWTILAASVAGLAFIGWWLYRGTRSKVENRKQKTEIKDRGQSINLESREQKSEVPPSNLQSPISHLPSPISPPSAFPKASPLIFIFCFLLSALLLTELGIRGWFALHERPKRSSVIDFAAHFEAGGATLKPLSITREVRGMLEYDTGAGWEWQGGGAERWQAFYFVWNEPKSLARRIISAGAATGHQPELCFTRAGMELRKIYGKQRYVANGVPLVFKVYEFADRNIPIFVFASTWERNVPQTTKEEDQLKGTPSTSQGFRQAVHQFLLGQRGITDEVRVFKLGVWGPRTVGEAEAAFQQQLNLLVHPAS